MLEYLLEELERNKEQYNILKYFTVKLAYVNEVYKIIRKNLRGYEETKNNMAVEIKQDVLAVLATLVEGYGLFKRPGEFVYFLAFVVALIDGICINDTIVTYKSLKEYKEKLKEFGYDISVSDENFELKREKLKYSIQGTEKEFKEVERRIQILEEAIASPDILSVCSLHPEIICDYLKQEFDNFLNERIVPEKVNITAPLELPSDMKIYKRAC